VPGFDSPKVALALASPAMKGRFKNAVFVLFGVVALGLLWRMSRTNPLS